VGGTAAVQGCAPHRAYGTVDELNAFVGAACLTTEELSDRNPDMIQMALILKRVQHELFNLGLHSGYQAGGCPSRQPRVTEAEGSVTRIGDRPDERRLAGSALVVLPGGCRANVELHVCRTVCRRRRANLRCLGSRGGGSARDSAVSEPAQRRVFRLEPLGKQPARSAEVLWEPNRAASALGKEEE